MKHLVHLALIILLLSSTTNAWGQEMLKVGDSAPDFKAKDFNGQSIDTKALRAEGPLVLVFLRGFGCPYSRKHLGQMRDDYEKFIERNAKIIVVARHDPKKVKDYWTENKLPYIGIPDPDAKLGDLYHQQKKLLKLGLMPAMFVVDEKGKIVFAHYSNGMSDIPKNETVLNKL